MRKKIAKRLKKECVRRGAKIVWDTQVRRGECPVAGVVAEYRGVGIMAGGKDLLMAYQMLKIGMNELDVEGSNA